MAGLVSARASINATEVISSRNLGDVRVTSEGRRSVESESNNDIAEQQLLPVKCQSLILLTRDSSQFASMRKRAAESCGSCAQLRSRSAPALA